MSDELRDLVVLGSRLLAENGHGDMVWGHLSVRDPEDRGVWVKRAGLGFDELTRADIQLVAWDGRVLAGDGAPHVERFIHLGVMRARADVGAVLHSHPESAVVLGATGLPLLAVGHEATYFAPGGLPRYTATGDLIRTPELGDDVAAALGDHRAALLVNHGIVVADSSVERTVFAAILLEKAARMTLAAVAAVGGADAVAVSSPAEALAKRDRCYADSQVRSGWDYLVRTLQKGAAHGG